MSLAFRYIGLKYLRSFLLIFGSLLIFFLSIDIMGNFGDLPSSASLKVLFLINSAYYQMTIIVPLALLFGFVLFVINLIKNNIFTAIYSVGLSKRQLIAPVLVVVFVVTTLMTIAQSTKLAYAEDSKKQILKGTYFDNQKQNLFLKYNEFFVFFGELRPILKTAKDIKIFKIVENKLIYEIEAKTATYEDNAWRLHDTRTIQTDKSGALNISKETSKILLSGFKPKIMDKVYDEKNIYSITDAIDTYNILKTQNIDTSSIRASFYWTAVLPFFVLGGVLLIFSYISTNARFFDHNRFTLSSIGFSLFLWGVLFFLYKLSNSATISPEFSMLVPFVIINIVAIWTYAQRRGNL